MEKEKTGKDYELVFVGVDFWCRPVFRRGTSKHLYGSVDVLVEPSDTKEDVLRKITIQDITYFGTEFDGDPLGTPIHKDLVLAPLQEA